MKLVRQLVIIYMLLTVLSLILIFALLMLDFKGINAEYLSIFEGPAYFFVYTSLAIGFVAISFRYSRWGNPKER